MYTARGLQSLKCRSVVRLLLCFAGTAKLFIAFFIVIGLGFIGEICLDVRHELSEVQPQAVDAFPGVNTEGRPLVRVELLRSISIS